MTPTPKHIEEARRLATAACDKLRFDYPGTLFHIRIPETARDLSKHLNLPTLLAAQEELEKWKRGCETNADCYRTAVRAQDEQRLELIKLRAELAMANDATDQGPSEALIERIQERLNGFEAEHEKCHGCGKSISTYCEQCLHLLQT